MSKMPWNEMYTEFTPDTLYRRDQMEPEIIQFYEVENPMEDSQLLSADDMTRIGNSDSSFASSRGGGGQFRNFNAHFRQEQSRDAVPSATSRTEPHMRNSMGTGVYPNASMSSPYYMQNSHSPSRDSINQNSGLSVEQQMSSQSRGHRSRDQVGNDISAFGTQQHQRVDYTQSDQSHLNSPFENDKYYTDTPNNNYYHDH